MGQLTYFIVSLHIPSLKACLQKKSHFEGFFCTNIHFCTGGTQFSLWNIGYGTCASAYESGFVMIGGGRGGSTLTSHHGRVDRYLRELILW